MFRKVLDLTILTVATALVTGAVRDHVQDFQAFQVANPGSDFWAYLVDLGWPAFTGVLLAIGAWALVNWWTRDTAEGADERASRKTSVRLPIKTYLLPATAVALGIWVGLQDWPAILVALGGMVICFVGWLIRPETNDDNDAPQEHGIR